MSDGVSFHVENDVAWVGLSDHGPSVLTRNFAVSLDEALTKVAGNSAIKLVVLSGTPKGFVRGYSHNNRPSIAEIAEISQVLGRVEEFPIPIVALIPDAAVNEGLELAMAAHFRIAAATARFGINHIATGLIPALGGTQRLPRLAGAKTALEILLNGKLITAPQAQAAGLVDLVTETDFSTESATFIRDLIDGGAKPRPTKKLVSGQSDPQRYVTQMAEAKKLVEKFHLPAAGAIVECIEAAQVTPLQTGLVIERSKYEICLRSDEAISLQHIATAERRLSKPGASSGGFVNVCVLAAKAEDSGLCVALLDAGFEVTVVDHLGPPNRSMSGSIIGIYDQAVQNGRMSTEVRSSRIARLDVVLAGEAIGPADVYVDAGKLSQSVVVEWLLSRLETLESKPLLLSSRTVDEANELQSDLNESVYCAAFHFEKLPHIAKCVEVFPVGNQGLRNLDPVLEFFRIAKRLPVSVNGGSEPISSRIRKVLFETAEALLLNGAEPKSIDGVLGSFGFRQGPPAMRDEVGLELDVVLGQQPATEALIKSGRTGRAQGLGYFRYAKGDSRPRPDSVVVWSLTSTRERLGVTAQDFSDTDILHLFIGALANLGAQLVDQEVVQRASDVDVVAVHSIGFPRRKGGPMQAAEQIGLFKIAQTLDRFAGLAPALWTVQPLINDLIKYGQGFEEMDIPDLEEAS